MVLVVGEVIGGDRRIDHSGGESFKLTVGDDDHLAVEHLVGFHGVLLSRWGLG